MTNMAGDEIRQYVKKAPDGCPLRPVLFSRYHIKKLGYCLQSISRHTVRQRPFHCTSRLSTSVTAEPVQRHQRNRSGLRLTETFFVSFRITSVRLCDGERKGGLFRVCIF